MIEASSSAIGEKISAVELNLQAGTEVQLFFSSSTVQRSQSSLASVGSSRALPVQVSMHSLLNLINTHKHVYVQLHDVSAYPVE